MVGDAIFLDGGGGDGVGGHSHPTIVDSPLCLTMPDYVYADIGKINICLNQV